jgi:cytochrome P450
VHHVVDGDYWVLTRFADVWAAAGDPATFSSARGLTVLAGEIEATGMGDATPMAFLDPPSTPSSAASSPRASRRAR